MGSIGGKKFKVPILAAAMDGVVDVKFAVAMGKMGGLAVLNLDGNVAIVKKELKIERSLSEILQILSVNPFEKNPVLQLLTNPTNSFPDTPFPKQLTLFDF